MPQPLAHPRPDAWSDFRRWWAGQQAGSGPRVVRFYEASPLLSAVAMAGHSVIGVIDVKSMQYVYLSPNFGTYLGRDIEDYRRGGVRFAFSIIHPDDVPGVVAFSEKINLYFQELPDEKRPRYRTYWDFRLLNEEGSYFKVLQQDCVLRHDESGHILEKLLLATRIENVMADHSQYLRMTDGTESTFYKFDHQTQALSLLGELSRREMEIARLIAKSHSLKEIASLLDISFNTVRVHCANMMEKLKVHDSIEMVNLLSLWGFM